MEYVYVKDSEGYVFKKLASEVTADEKIITEKEYMKKSGLAGYEKLQIRVPQEEKDFIAYAREHHLSYSAMMKQQRRNFYKM